MVKFLMKLTQMKRDKLYLDTSVVSAYFDGNNPERQKITVKFWKKVLPKYHVFISEITVEE